MYQQKIWFSCEKFTIGLTVEGEPAIIIQAAPIARKFVGQPLANLTQWAERNFGKVIIEELHND